MVCSTPTQGPAAKSPFSTAKSNSLSVVQSSFQLPENFGDSAGRGVGFYGGTDEEPAVVVEEDQIFEPATCDVDGLLDTSTRPGREEPLFDGKK